MSNAGSCQFPFIGHCAIQAVVVFLSLHGDWIHKRFILAFTEDCLVKKKTLHACVYSVLGLVTSEGYTTCMYNVFGLVASEGHTTCMYNVLNLVAREGYTSCVYIVYPSLAAAI